MAGGRGQARTQRVELVMEALLGLLAVGDQTAPMAYRRPKFLHCRFLGLAPATALAGQIGQRCAVTVIGLEPARAQLHARGPCLGRCEQPNSARMQPLQLRRPPPVQASGRLDRDHRRRHGMHHEHLLQRSDPRPSDGQ